MSSNFSVLVDVLRPILDKDTTMDSSLAVTCGRVVSGTIGNLHDVIRCYCSEIEKAKNYVLIASSYWEGGSLSAFMLASSLRRVIRRHSQLAIRIVVDNGKRENLGRPGNIRVIDRVRWKAELGISFDADIEARSVHVPLLGTMHAKFLVVDGKKVVLSSNNVQDRPNAEMAVTLSGPVVRGFEDIFFRLFFFGGNPNGGISTTPPIRAPAIATDGNRHYQPMMIVARKMHGGFFHDVVSPQNCAWWTMMSLARRSIVISTPTLNAKHAIEAIMAACKRNVDVLVVLTKNFNDKKEALPFQGGTNVRVVNRMKRKLKKWHCLSRLTIKWYTGERETQPRKGVHSHVKFICVDDELVMFGNGNMDTQSWYHSMEVNVILENAELARRLLSKVLR